MQLLTVVVLVVASIQLAAGAANQCYACAVLGCNDPFNANSVGVTKTPAVNGWCMKIKNDQNGQTVVVRSSDVGVCSKNRCEKQTAQGITGTLCCCDSDLCNAAPRSVSTIAVGFMVSLIAVGFAAHFY